MSWPDRPGGQGAGGRLAAVIALLALAAPFAAGDNRYLGFVVGMTALNVLWASSMNLLYGYLGLMPLMFAGVAGIATYAMIHLTAQMGWSFWLATPVACLLAAVAGVLLGLPSLRLKGFYFTLCSLVIQTVLTLAFIFFPTYTNGDTGINAIAAPQLPGGGPLSGLAFDLLLVVLAITVTVAVGAIVRSPLGQRFVAIREDELLAEALGIHVTRYKITGFFIMSLLAALGGCLSAPYVGFVSPRSFDVLVSLNVWLMVAFGGRGTLLGPVIGALILAPIPYLLQDLQALRDILYGGLIILVTLAMPSGLYGALRARRARGANPAMAEQRV